MNTKAGDRTYHDPDLPQSVSIDWQATLHQPFRLSITHAGLRRLQRWIAVKGAVSLSLKQAADIASLEPHYFSVLFHQCAGQSFLAWRRAYRAGAAVCLIKNADFSVSEIASMVGYRDRRSLERALKAFTGRTPGSFKNDDRHTTAK